MTFDLRGQKVKMEVKNTKNLFQHAFFKFGMWALLVILSLSKPKLLISEVIGGQSTKLIYLLFIHYF